jgi:threonine dehydratase
MATRLGLDEIVRARETIRPYLAPTPLVRSRAVPGTEALLKLECRQPTGSFKVRGALNLLASLAEDERQRGCVTASAGNHALGVAFAAQRLGGVLRVTVFVPRTAPRTKVDKLKAFPVDVRESGESYEEAEAAARAFEHETGAFFVHAFEDPRTAAGQGTVGLELIEECPDLGAVVVPVGGGGLLAGLAVAVKARSPSVRVVAVQPEASPALLESLRLGRPLLTYPAGPTLADGLAGGIGEIAFAHRHLVDDVVAVSEDEIAAAIVVLHAQDAVEAEGAGAVGIAALNAGRVPLPARGPVAAVITGGNIDRAVLARLTARER